MVLCFFWFPWIASEKKYIRNGMKYDSFGLDCHFKDNSSGEEILETPAYLLVLLVWTHFFVELTCLDQLLGS